MTYKSLRYTPYNPSWSKLCFALIGNIILPNLSFIAYSGHNLYSYFQYNKSLEKEIKIKLDREDEARVVKCTTENDSYARPIFDACVFTGSLFSFYESNDLNTLEFIGLCTILSKINHLLSPAEEKFHFTDINTGEEISFDKVEDAEFLKFIS